MLNIKQVTIDVSPPAPGHVKDSRTGTPDIDFQSSFVHHAHWQGFFDKESGVMFYQYGFSDSCLPSEDFIPTSENVSLSILFVFVLICASVD